MTYRVCQVALDDKLCQQNQLEILEKIYPGEHIFDILTELHARERRERGLNSTSEMKRNFIARNSLGSCNKILFMLVSLKRETED